MFISPLALADSVLTDSEKRSGCVLVDLGAQTTTIAVYSKSLLRHLAVIPLGGANITKDIASLQIEEEHAERLKLTYGAAYTHPEEDNTGLTYAIDSDRSIQSDTFMNVVEARIEEIIANVRYQIPEKYEGKLLGGLILTGGGAQLKNIEEAFQRKTNFNKIRFAKTVRFDLHSKHPEITAQDGTMNTVLGLLAKGNLNCAGREISNNLFPDAETERSATLPSEGEHMPNATDNRAQQEQANNKSKFETKEKKEDKAEKKQANNEPEEEKGPTKFKQWKEKLSGFIRQMAEEE